MRKHFMLMLLLLTALGATAQDFDEVDTADKFEDAVKWNKNIRLTADIDIRDMGMLDVTYKGIIDGLGYNENGDSIFYSLIGGTGSGRVANPIFKALDGATLQNLVIRNFRIEYDDDYIGAVARTAKNSKFKQVIVSEVSLFNDDDYAGAIVGKAENCDFRQVKCMGNDVTVDGNRAGGFVGVSYNSVYCDCSNSAYSTVYSDGSWGNAYAGGFVGESYYDQFVFCANFASVGALDDRIGGIVGYATGSIFNNCTNSGHIMHCEESDFITCTDRMKAKLNELLNDTSFIKEIQDNLEEQYKNQGFDLAAGFVSFIGTLGLSTAAFSAELCLLAVTAASIGAFTATIIIAATGITVTLINLIDAEIGAHDEMGGICGTCESSVFDCCANYGTLLCRDSYVGGIVGLMRDMPANSKITNCLNAGEIKGFDLIGGIFGESNPDDKITNCLNVGDITLSSHSDGKSDPIGNVARTDLGVSHCYYRAQKGDPGATVRIPVTADQLANGTVAGWLNGGVSVEGAPWRQSLTDPYPVLDPSHDAANPLRHDDVFAVSSPDDLDSLRTAVNSGTKDSYIVYITEDIDCSGKTWEPIGTFGHPFTGVCFGGGHTISNLNTANDTTKNGIGFFGVVGLNTEVRDLFIGSGEIRGGHSIGAIIGYAEHRNETEGYIRIIGCGNAATITGDYDCGGIIGAIYSDKLMRLTLDNCYNMGSVNADRKSAALCGFAKKNALVTSCWNTGSVTGYESGKGFVRGDDDAAPEIHNCYVALSLSALKQNGVKSFTPDDAKNGTLCYKLNGSSNDASVGLPWEQDITSGAAYPSYKGYSEERKGIYTSRMVSGRYGTVVLPYTVQSNDSIRFYTLTDVTESLLHFNSVDTLEAGTPAIFRVASSGTYEFISITEEFSVELNDIEKEGWTMTGNLDIDGKDMVFTDSAQLKNLYYISDEKIKSATNKLTISPFRAYIIGPSNGSSAPARTLSVSFDDEGSTTDIRFVRTDVQDKVTTGESYNISGQRAGSLQKGIIIVGGKKFFIK